LCDYDIATNFGAVAGEVILVDSCAIIFIYCDCCLFFWKKKRETKFLLAAVLFIYGSGIVQNIFFGGIRYHPFVF
jgi:hypothetical protein